jgi:mutator protein MutT
MKDKIYPNPVITFVIQYKGKYILLHRGKNEKNYADLWAFPGGKVELGETAIETIVREAQEEVGLTLKKKIAFLDTYAFGSSVGLAFLVEATSDKVTLSDDFQAYSWVSSLRDLKKYPCVPGIYNHLKYALAVRKNNMFMQTRDANLLPKNYINK